MRHVSIGEAARDSGVKVPTIRYYEQIGLLPAPARSAANRRFYGESDLRRLAFIRHARALGFEIEAIRSLLALQEEPNRTCSTAHDIAKARLADVVERIEKLNALRVDLVHMIAMCDLRDVAACGVIEGLANHAKCVHAEH
jgi:DNA-binding transcriptional MerR regulator